MQVYEGFVHMDFLPFFAKTQPYGNYTKLPVAGLPPLFLAYAADPSDSGRIHAPVKQRWLAGTCARAHTHTHTHTWSK